MLAYLFNFVLLGEQSSHIHPSKHGVEQFASSVMNDVYCLSQVFSLNT